MIYATDLDRTLIFSKKFLKEDIDSICIEKKDTKEISYVTKHCLELFNEVQNKLILIPVTTRSIEQYKRIELTKDLPYAIVSNGGNILFNGEIFKPWSEKTEDIIHNSMSEYHIIIDIAQKINKYFTRNMELVDNIFFFAKIKESESVKKTIISYLEKNLHDTNWNFTIQGLKLYIIPKDISKENALKFLCDYLNEEYLVTSGDGKLDKNFINLGNEKIIPSESEVLNYIKDISSYKIVGSGLKGTEEMLQYILSLHERV